MRKTLALLAIAIGLGWGVLSMAAESKDDSPKQPPDLKTRIENGEKRLATAERMMKANAELRDEELKAAKHEIENAKNLLAAGKEDDAKAALMKARRHAMFALGQPHKRMMMRRRMMMIHPGGGMGMGMAPGMGRGMDMGRGPGMGRGMGMGMNPDCPMVPPSKKDHPKDDDDSK